MKYLLSLILICSAMAQDNSQTAIAKEFARRWTATRKMAIGVAEAMPPEQYAFKPDPPSMNFGEQITHVASINYSFCAALREQKKPAMPSPADKRAFVKFLGDSFDYC